MARKVTVLDDLTNEEGAETVTFTVAGRTYEIDLVEANQAKLVKALDRFIKAGRDITPIPRTGSDPYANVDQTAVRSWALAKGLDVPERGRVPMWAVAQYNAEQAAPAPEPAADDSREDGEPTGSADTPSEETAQETT
jgi:hypothetical protein